MASNLLRVLVVCLDWRKRALGRRPDAGSRKFLDTGIRHARIALRALSAAIRSLSVTMIEPAFLAGLMSRPSSTAHLAACFFAAGRAAVLLPTITRPADEEERATSSARFLPK